MKKKTKLFAAAAAAFGVSVTGAYAQDTSTPQPNPPARQPADQQPAENAQPQDQTQAQDQDASGTIVPKKSGEQADKQAQKGRLLQVDDLIGAKIRNAQDEDLGEVEEMVVDVNDGSIRYAVVSYGGFLDIGDKLFAVPLKAMSLKSNADGEPFFVVDIDKQRLENAKGFDDDNWPNFADRSFTSTVDKTYGIKTDQQQASGRQGALYKLSTFDGVNVRGQGNTEIGEVDWILVDPQKAKVAYLALDLDDDVENENANDDGDVLVPMSQFSLKTQNDDTFLLVKAPLDKIRSAPKMTEDQLKNPEMQKQIRQKIDSHFGAAASNDAQPQSSAQPQDSTQPSGTNAPADSNDTTEPQSETAPQ